ncbi:site-specific integrase (plasmid) [Halorubrum sp. BOL3-1]|uniref:tyrosine-type recombinase/integrase n=1 Tax=Halorubrum sp. BOL3-1 TaxID=2497325 RepID=UPI0010050951|nr:tyrosine-type recombinase/integrase [Halorubrum sp. BOL3-1]QAU11357.1 site-specific integrase [Halorubrum sp. BOL3-1]
MSTTHTDVTNPDVQHTDSDGRTRTWLKPEQVDQMRDVCFTDAVPTYLQDRNEAIVALLYDAGLRAGELCALDVDHLDLDAGTVYLPSRIQKGSPPPATLKLATDTVRLLRRYLRDRWKDTDALFPTRSSDRLTTRSLQRLVEKLATEADVQPQVAGGGVGDPDDITPHTLRHSVAHRIIQLDGGRLEDVQLRLRHANRQTTDQIYSHLVPR